MVMHLNSCCCGCSLKTGTVIIGVLGAIGSLASLIGYIALSAVLNGEVQKEMGVQQDEQLNKAMEAGSTAIYVIFIILAVISALHLIISIMLIFGASSERPALVKPWIVYNVIATVAAGIMYFVYFILGLVAGVVAKAFLVLVMGAVAVTFAVYFILVVNSFHTELLSNTFSNKV